MIKLDDKAKKVNKSLDKFGRIKYLKMIGSKLDIITDNRNKKVMDELHKFSRGIINRALSIKAGIITIGKNPGWKQKINIGKKNNQNFVNIPFAKYGEI
jgi:putative transposase